jgi:hypothetical protein
MVLACSERTGPGGRRWPLFFLEERPDGVLLHRIPCGRWEKPTADLGRFATVRSAMAIARLETKSAVKVCPHCCSAGFSRAKP